MSLSALTRRYFEHPGLAGTLSGSGCFRGAAGSIAEGTWVQFDVEVQRGTREAFEATLTVRAVRFLAFGCPHVIAVAAWVAEQAVGRPAVPRLPEDVHALRERFEAPIEKLGRLLLVEDAWIAALGAAERAPGRSAEH